MKRTKKSKYKHIVINRKKYYFYKITWVDITGDAGHATAEEFDKFDASTMTTMGYIYSKDSKFLKTFASYDNKDEVFSDRNMKCFYCNNEVRWNNDFDTEDTNPDSEYSIVSMYPIGCILKMEKVNI
jgi:hypothetical protein